MVVTENYSNLNVTVGIPTWGKSPIEPEHILFEGRLGCKKYEAKCNRGVCFSVFYHDNYQVSLKGVTSTVCLLFYKTIFSKLYLACCYANLNMSPMPKTITSG